MMMEETLVYSTEIGRIEKEKKQKKQPISFSYGDGIIRIERQVSGRKGSAVSVIKGLNLPYDEMKALTTELKKRCGCGGSIKNGMIEIQGDKRDLLKQLLEEKNFSVKLAGG
ncbi:Putative Conserved protein [Avibacterium paragallinarum JF4211]|uniref:Translation initiation factor 1-like proterin n=2 Tax=Avibacterium paragallinarum TaxID=728 RepID=A0A380X0M4_AVIPA|nr:Putative Conserved protein [Avibacterium paragallinarum JF4211]STO72375.1 translation initiation factor 1-like proterin [Avibacterium paragallinarum]SUU96765.1 translation initiation factor Sui1 [Avibacterium paragallinarum]